MGCPPSGPAWKDLVSRPRIYQPIPDREKSQCPTFQMRQKCLERLCQRPHKKRARCSCSWSNRSTRWKAQEDSRAPSKHRSSLTALVGALQEQVFTERLVRQICEQPDPPLVLAITVSEQPGNSRINSVPPAGCTYAGCRGNPVGKFGNHVSRFSQSSHENHVGVESLRR